MTGMTSQGSERTDATPRRLRRRTSDRVLGGVAGGIGDYFNIDPLLIRIGFVGLMIFGGAGLVLYVAGWLLIPADGHETSSVEGFFARLGLTPLRLAWIATAVLAFFVISAAMNRGGYISMPLGISMDSGAFFAIVAVVTGVLLLRRRETSSAVASTAATNAVVVAAPVVKAAPRPRSPLAWYACGTVLLAIGLLALVSQVADMAVAPGQFFGTALAILGIGLVVGAWWGRARILILLAILLAPLAVAASFVTAPLEGGIGGLRFTPANAAELREEYRMIGGELILDLTDLSIGRGPVHIAASVAVGQLVVILPPDASVELRARMGAGQVTVFDFYGAGTILGDAGTSLDERYVRHQVYGPTYILDLEGGIGEVLVTNSRTNW
jgi:phage shock protein PspC (stress-responsive transcriptional regulator)